MKQQLKPTRLEWVSFVIMMPMMAILLNYLLFHERLFTDIKVWLFSFSVIMAIGFACWVIQVAVMHWLRLRFPLARQTGYRLGILAVSHLLVITATIFLLFFCYDALAFLGYQLEESSLRTALYVGIGFTLIVSSMWEAEFTFNQWKNSIAEKEKMEQLTIEQEFETLKRQVNPHFLFNCFNTLSSLISEDRQQAESFLDELSKVYRYLLKNNEDGLSTLQTEITFIESYYRLLRTRHGDAIHLNIEVDRKYNQYLLPSLTLQLLVENAVKHNALSKNNPLVIDIITTSGNKLIVSNNLRPRTIKAPSNRIGLENIRNKYLLLKQPGFHVIHDKTFTVVLPLIWNKVAEKKLVTTD